MVGGGRIHGQGQVGEELAQHELRAGGRVDEVGVLADPAEAGVARERLLHHGPGVHEGAVAEGTDAPLERIRELLQSWAQDAVVVAAEGVARDVGAAGIGEHGCGGRPGREAVHAYADDALRAGDELGGPAAPAAVARHELHGALAALGEPSLEAGLVRGEVGAGDAHLLKPSASACSRR
jgi:hypothetical protein